MTHKSTPVSCLNVSIFLFSLVARLHNCDDLQQQLDWTCFFKSTRVCRSYAVSNAYIYICKKFVKSHNVGKIEKCCLLSCKCTIYLHQALHQLPHSSIRYEVKTESEGSGEGLPVEAGTASTNTTEYSIREIFSGVVCVSINGVWRSAQLLGFFKLFSLSRVFAMVLFPFI